MRRHIHVAAALAGLAFVLTGAQPTLRADAKSSVEEIRKELMQLPYYSVFDFLAFSYDKGTVTLSGYAYQSTLKHDAAHAAKRASGVDQVIDKIEDLPVSQNDNELRWKTYYAIYRDPFLSRLASKTSSPSRSRRPGRRKSKANHVGLSSAIPRRISATTRPDTTV
jgi:hypothetical protein